jgi:hypothetical protein
MNMTPTEQANQLVLDFSECGEDNEMYIGTAKKCAILYCKWILEETSSDVTYWREVIEEIKKIKI